MLHMYDVINVMLVIILLFLSRHHVSRLISSWMDMYTVSFIYLYMCIHRNIRNHLFVV